MGVRVKMNKFYGNNINNINIQYLLQATPFNKNSKINFSKHLKPEEFFNYLFVERKQSQEDIESVRANNHFDEEINKAIKYTKNIYSKVDLIHISGYAGCGKTTFIHSLLWKKYNQDTINNYIIDFEGEKKIVDAYIEVLADKISNYLNNRIINMASFNDIDNFNLNRFKDYLQLFHSLINELDKDYQYQSVITNKSVKSILMKQINYCFDSNTNNIYYLVFLDFIIELVLRVQNHILDPLLIVYDNLDSIDDISEENKFVSVLKTFINDCNFFFGNNLSNELEFCQRKISSIINEVKLICFLTTRIVTGRKIIELEPDLEMVYGWVSLKMPENYYNHNDILCQRINYYKSLETETNSHAISYLCEIETFSKSIYKNRIFKRMFNGNYRYCVYSICRIIDEFKSTGLISECNRLYNEGESLDEAQVGSTGIITSVLLNYLKSNDVFEKKLLLSECERDNQISLSRIILTIIREKEGNCSFLDLLRLLTPFFTCDQICTVVYALSESKRDIWRRLVIFGEKYPNSVDDLKLQSKVFSSKNTDEREYSLISLCTSGYEYLEFIVPHFEFMLSRHKFSKSFNSNRDCQPLFSMHSLDKINISTEQTYRFERKIDWVYQDVLDCCYNSMAFNNSAMEHFNLTKYEYLNNSYFNYRTINRDGSSGYRQSYESRLIFSHIGYVERYRRYLIWKFKRIMDITQLQDINKRLVIRIKRYIRLYTNSNICLQTLNQNEVAKQLLNSIQKIEQTSYFDFTTEIEVF